MSRDGQVLRFVDRAHASFAQQAQHAVDTDDLIALERRHPRRKSNRQARNKGCDVWRDFTSLLLEKGIERASPSLHRTRLANRFMQLLFLLKRRFHHDSLRSSARHACRRLRVGKKDLVRPSGSLLLSQLGKGPGGPRWAQER